MRKVFSSYLSILKPSKIYFKSPQKKTFFLLIDRTRKSIFKSRCCENFCAYQKCLWIKDKRERKIWWWIENFRCRFSFSILISFICSNKLNFVYCENKFWIFSLDFKPKFSEGIFLLNFDGNFKFIFGIFEMYDITRNYVTL